MAAEAALPNDNCKKDHITLKDTLYEITRISNSYKRSLIQS